MRQRLQGSKLAESQNAYINTDINSKGSSVIYSLSINHDSSVSFDKLQIRSCPSKGSM